METIDLILSILKRVCPTGLYSHAICFILGGGIIWAITSYMYKGQLNREIVKVNKENIESEKRNFIECQDLIHQSNQNERELKNIIDSLREENFKLKEDKHRLIIENMDLKSNTTSIESQDSS